MIKIQSKVMGRRTTTVYAVSCVMCFESVHAPCAVQLTHVLGRLAHPRVQRAGWRLEKVRVVVVVVMRTGKSVPYRFAHSYGTTRRELNRGPLAFRYPCQRGGRRALIM